MATIQQNTTVSLPPLTKVVSSAIQKLIYRIDRKGIVVLPEYQRRGIASKLSQRLNEIVDAERGTTYVIAVPASMPMFKMQGFETIGTKSTDMAKFGGSSEKGMNYVMLRKPHSKVTANS